MSWISGDDDMLTTLFAAAISGAIIMVVVLANWGFRYAACSARWADSGLQSSWGPLTGCRVRTQAGQWIPEGAVRQLPGGGQIQSQSE